ncbi:carboxyl transferase domain-containing protein [Pediococcus acidilactici]|uniref:carboxyl transferase domain-containing protein n=1 Tax=Pediococcus acidilactici TaxID=1254 RepID=UPI002F2698BB
MAKINGLQVNIGAFETRFRMGSMGQNVGSMIYNLSLKSLKNKVPLVLVIASGGARMQEGIFSLYQMVKTVNAIEKLKKAGIPTIALLTDPTTGGVFASFVSEMDYLIAEPKAQIGFAGKRVVQSTLSIGNQTNYQNSESHLRFGHIDDIVNRPELKKYLSRLLKLHRTNKTEKVIMQVEKLKNSKIVKQKNLREQEYSKILDRVRSPHRKNSWDYISNIFDNIIEFHGDRINYDDGSVFTGIGDLEGITFTIIGQLHDSDLNKNIKENYGMTRPAGYRKINRNVELAVRYHRPIVVFIDTKGADPLPNSEKENQAKAIADSIATFLQAETPIITFLIGEGGSGGAIAIGVSDKFNMLSNSIFSVISPEGAAEILWHDQAKKIEAMKSLKMTAQELYSLGLIDNVIDSTSKKSFDSLIKEMKTLIISELSDIILDPEFLEHRTEKYIN